MIKKVTIVLVIVVGIAAGLLAVKIGDGLMAPRDTEQVEVKPTGITLSEETWERLEEVLDIQGEDD